MCEGNALCTLAPCWFERKLNVVMYIPPKQNLKSQSRCLVPLRMKMNKDIGQTTSASYHFSFRLREHFKSWLIAKAGVGEVCDRLGQRRLHAADGYSTSKKACDRPVC